MTTNNQARTYFEILADLGVTKHYGSLDATRELVEACCITPGNLVLDIGCGVGATPAFLTKAVGCRVVGLDLIEKMLIQARHLIKGVPAGRLTGLLAADAWRLPFPDDIFDAVIMESLNVFYEDKLVLFPEYIRVTKPGGFVGLTEMTWLEEPSQKLEALFKNAAYATALDAGGWIKVLVEAGLENVAGRAYRIDVSRESKGRMERYGVRYVFKVLLRTIRLVLTSKKHRSIFRDGVQGLSKDALNMVGYGVFAGQKRSNTSG